MVLPHNDAPPATVASKTNSPVNRIVMAVDTALNVVIAFELNSFLPNSKIIVGWFFWAADQGGEGGGRWWGFCQALKRCIDSADLISNFS